MPLRALDKEAKCLCGGRLSFSWDVWLNDSINIAGFSES